MFLKSLSISSGRNMIRHIPFHKGINLIVDESEGHITGNNVGKTTVLKLIDFCFGADKKIIWEDPENKKDIYKLVKDYLIDNNILISLRLKENLEMEDSVEVIIERNFLTRNKAVRRINGQDYPEKDYESKLLEIFFPDHLDSKPSFRQILSHNIRYKDLSIANTLKTLDMYTSDVEYETLYLFLLGCSYSEGDSKQEILQKINQEDNFRRRLEAVQTKSAYETALSLINNDIKKLDERKSRMNLNENFEADLDRMNRLKYSINLISADLSNLKIRRDLIIDAGNDLTLAYSKIDMNQLKLIYNQAKVNMGSLHKSFEDLYNYHNQMIKEKAKYITKELPEIKAKIKEKKSILRDYLHKEKELSEVITKSGSFEELEMIIGELTEKFRQKGEYEKIIEQLEEVEGNLKIFNDNLKSIDDELFSEVFETQLKIRLNKFNEHFAATSQLLYGEKYALKYEKAINRKRQRFYKFSAFNLNFSSGKKQGEISCFDIAYTFFADEENINCMHFLLNDKKELMHDNQLVKIADLAEVSNIQFVASILKDKLPNELNKDENFILKLSDNDKLFRIENNL